MSTKNGQKDGIEFSDYHRNHTILDFLQDADDDKSNKSNESFMFDKSYHKEFKRKQRHNEEIMKNFQNEEENNNANNSVND